MFLNVVCYDKCYHLLRFGNCPASLIKKKTQMVRNWMFQSSDVKTVAHLASLQRASRSHVEKGRSLLGPQLPLKLVQKTCTSSFKLSHVFVRF